MSNKPVTAITKIEPDDSHKTNARYKRWKQVVPLPPDSLMWSVGGANIENFLVVGDAWAQVVSRYTKPNCTVLDIGSGCARTARMLLNNRWISRYIGFDVIRENVEWSNKFLSPAFTGEKCEFHHYDIYSGEYNPDGKIQCAEFRFPCDEATVDVTFAASIFTHLLEEDARHYLSEVGRVLRPGGTAILSIHDQVSPGQRFQGNEARIDMERSYFREMAKASGLDYVDLIPDLAGQVTFIFKRTGESRGLLSSLFGSSRK